MTVVQHRFLVRERKGEREREREREREKTYRSKPFGFVEAQCHANLSDFASVAVLHDSVDVLVAQHLPSGKGLCQAVPDLSKHAPCTGEPGQTARYHRFSRKQERERKEGHKGGVGDVPKARPRLS